MRIWVALLIVWCTWLTYAVLELGKLNAALAASMNYVSLVLQETAARLALLLQ